MNARLPPHDGDVHIAFEIDHDHCARWSRDRCGELRPSRANIAERHIPIGYEQFVNR